MAITAQELIDMGRSRADFTSSPYLQPLECLRWCRESYKELWDLMVEAYGEDYVSASTTLDVPPTDWPKLDVVSPPFYKLLHLSRTVENLIVPMERFRIQDVVFDNAVTDWGSRTDIRYQVSGKEIYFQPRPVVTETITMVYVPQAVLADLTSEIEWSAEPWAEYIVIDLAIKMRRKEQSDTSDFMIEKDAMRRRIIAIAHPRDLLRPPRVLDVRSLDGSEEWWEDWL